MFDPLYVRDVPGWKNAPVPICQGGDPRALAFCCDPRYPLTHEQRCGINRMLEEIGLSKGDYLDIKLNFSEEMGWADERVCFGTMAFCCLRRRGCPNRDPAVKDICGNFEDYFTKKRILALRILKAAENREMVEPYIKYEEEMQKKEIED
ncbi:MAG: hypothetical protein SVM80_12250 [Halobacteriota archaeon]|nr:hypothetical protein [Halobacteriota archaeon]